MEKRKQIFTKINDREYQINAIDSFKNLAQYLREDIDLPGTKVVCGEGDCGACTVLIGKDLDAEGKIIYKAVNSCILPLYLIDGAHIVTVEGVGHQEKLHEVQKQMVDHHGSQCGYCTPGFICSMTWMTEKLSSQNKKIDEKRAKNFLTGNLCRCTGYRPIVEAAVSIDLKKIEPLRDRYYDPSFISKIKKIKKESLIISEKHFQLMLPESLEEALLLKEVEPSLKIVAGNTDLGVLKNKGKMTFTEIMSLTHIKSLKQIKLDKEFIKVGATVTLSEFEDFVEDQISELKNLLHIFASPQIKNQGTIIGNVLNASPIGDTIPFLMCLDALVVIESSKGEREVVLKDFYLGYKNLDLRPNELVTAIKIPRLKNDEYLSLFKVSMRKDLDISAVTFAGKISLTDKKIKSINLAYGGVAATVLRMTELERKLNGADFSRETFIVAAEELNNFINPLSDLRASREYRMLVSKNYLLKFFDETNEKIIGEV